MADLKGPPGIVLPATQDDAQAAFSQQIMRWIETPFMSKVISQGDPKLFLRACIAEATAYGLPTHMAVLMDNLAAMAGMYEPLSVNEMRRLTAPVVGFRDSTDGTPRTVSRQLETYAVRDRFRNALGLTERQLPITPSEVVVALGNLTDTAPADWLPVFQWAATHVQSAMDGKSRQQTAEANEWPFIEDDDVVAPTGRYYAVYQTVATAVRREQLAAVTARGGKDVTNMTRELFDHLKSRIELRLANDDRHADDQESRTAQRMLAVLDEQLPA